MPPRSPLAEAFIGIIFLGILLGGIVMRAYCYFNDHGFVICADDKTNGRILLLSFLFAAIILYWQVFVVALVIASALIYYPFGRMHRRWLAFRAKRRIRQRRNIP